MGRLPVRDRERSSRKSKGRRHGDHERGRDRDQHHKHRLQHREKHDNDRRPGSRADSPPEINPKRERSLHRVTDLVDRDGIRDPIEADRDLVSHPSSSRKRKQASRKRKREGRRFRDSDKVKEEKEEADEAKTTFRKERRKRRRLKDKVHEEDLGVQEGVKPAKEKLVNGDTSNGDMNKSGSAASKFSKRNAASREKRPLEDGHGSKTIVAHLHGVANAEMGALPNVQAPHFKQNKGRRDEHAAQKSDAISELHGSQASSMAESAAPLVGFEDYGSPATSSRSRESREEDQQEIAALKETLAIQSIEEIALLKERLAMQEVMIAQLQKIIAQQQEIIAKDLAAYAQLEVLVPGFKMPQPPVPSQE